jgi:flagellar motor switch protein FliM
MPFMEFLEGQSEPDCVWIFNLEKLDGKGIIEMSPPLALMMVERLFGGDCAKGSFDRGVTSIEVRVVEKIIRKCLEFYNQAWDRVEQLHPVLETFESDPRLAQIASASESCMVAVWDVTIKEVTNSIKVCLPVFALDPIIRKLSAQSWLSIGPKKKTPMNRRQIQSVIESTELAIKAYLGSTTVTMKELVDFQIGDVVILDQKIRNLLRVDVGEKNLFWGRAGLIGTNRAIRIVNLCKPEV